MKNSNVFKVLFWIFTTIYILAIGFAIVVTSGELIYAPGVFKLNFLLLIIVFLGFLLIPFLISWFVYRDAPKRGMNKWMWMLIAVYVPNCIGIIIYLVARGEAYLKCKSCGRKVEKDFEVCPYCGEGLKSKCPSCNKSISEDFRICPYCENKLK